MEVEALLPGRAAGCGAFVELAGKVAVVVERVGTAEELFVETCPGRRRGAGRDGIDVVSRATCREIDDCERFPKLPRSLSSTLLVKPAAGLVRSNSYRNVVDDNVAQH